MAINTTAIANLLRPGVAAIFGSYMMYPSMWSDVFETYESDKAQEVEVEMKMLGLAQIRPEGSPTAQGTMAQEIVTTYIHQYVALSFSITRQAIKDNLYRTKFPMMVKSLKNSMAQTKEILGASILNNGFSTAQLGGDGVPLFSALHPIAGGPGTYANRLTTAADLSEASLESAIIGIQQFRDQAGLIVKTVPKKMIVPPQNQFVAERLLGSSFRTNTANNDISATYSLSSIPDGYRVNQFLTSPTFWMILTDAQDGFKHYIREAVETDVYTDFSTDNLLCKAVERYSFFWSNPRAGFASGSGLY